MYAGARRSRAGLQARIRSLVVRMATENPTWGEMHSTQSRAGDDLAHVSPRALAPLVAADFFTSEVWTAPGSGTYDAVFVIELQLRRVHVERVPLRLPMKPSFCKRCASCRMRLTVTWQTLAC
jgi:hypothetical protein